MYQIKGAIFRLYDATTTGYGTRGTQLLIQGKLSRLTYDSTFNHHAVTHLNRFRDDIMARKEKGGEITNCPGIVAANLYLQQIKFEPTQKTVMVTKKGLFGSKQVPEVVTENKAVVLPNKTVTINIVGEKLRITHPLNPDRIDINDESPASYIALSPYTKDRFNGSMRRVDVELFLAADDFNTVSAGTVEDFARFVCSTLKDYPDMPYRDREASSIKDFFSDENKVINYLNTVQMIYFKENEWGYWDLPQPRFENTTILPFKSLFKG